MNDKAKELLGLDNPWPTKDVIKKLVWATKYLLNDKSYDGEDYEELELCIQRGNEIINILESYHQSQSEQRWPSDEIEQIIIDFENSYPAMAVAWDTRDKLCEWLRERIIVFLQSKGIKIE